MEPGTRLPLRHAANRWLVTNLIVDDSYVYASWDRAFQGDGWVINNSYVASPSESEVVWNGLDAPIEFRSVPGVCTQGAYGMESVITFNGGVLLGSVTSNVTVSNSDIWNTSGYTDGGGNTILQSRLFPPAIPTHTELDAIWSP